MSDLTAARSKKADLASAGGAGVLGAGLGVMFASHAAGMGPALVVVGALLHGWGMFGKRRLEAGVAMPRWATALYWLCWVVLAALIVWIAIRQGGSQ
jgi:hypothetical protein